MNPDLVAQNSVGVKICGIQTLDDALLCIEKGADAIGLNFWSQSKRYVSRTAVEGWIEKLPSTFESQRMDGKQSDGKDSSSERDKALIKLYQLLETK